LAAERERLQSQVADNRRELLHSKNQTAELRQTMSELESQAAKLQLEQQRQAKFLSDAQSKKGTDSSPQLSRQVEAVKGVIETQEQKLARIEAGISEVCVAQRGQLREAMEQGRQLSRLMEDEAARRQQSMNELQQMLLQERTRDGAIPGKLQAEIAKATQAIQGQSGEWMELAKVIKSEVGALAGELRTDREVRALEASNQRFELARMIEETRLANVASTMGGFNGFAAESDGDLNVDMMSKAGAVAVHKMVDTTKALLHNLEQALLLRAGFLAGVFHTWRSEVTLLKAGYQYRDEFGRCQDEWTNHFEDQRRAFEDELRRAAEHHLTHKEISLQRAEHLIMTWAKGEVEGLRRGVFRAWGQYAHSEQSLRRSAASIHKACAEWIQGNTKALKHEVFSSWRFLTAAQSSERRMTEALEEREHEFSLATAKAQRVADAKINEALARLEALNRRAKSGIMLAMGKLLKGDKFGVMTVILQAFVQNTHKARLVKKQSMSVQQAMTTFLLHRDRAVLFGCVEAWRKELLNQKEVKDLKRQFEEIVAGQRAELAAEKAEAEDLARQRLEASRQAVHLAVAKFTMGETTGLKTDILKAWSKWCRKKAEADRRRKAVMVQIMKWAEGEARAYKYNCFLAWKHELAEAIQVRRHEEVLEAQKKSFELFLEGEQKKHMKEIDAMKSEEQKRDAEKDAILDYTMSRWNKGETKGILGSALRSWQKVTKELKEHDRKRRAVRTALLSSMAGVAQANLMMAFRQWHGMLEDARRERAMIENINAERKQWEDRELELLRIQRQATSEMEAIKANAQAKAHAESEMMIRKWLGAEAQGLVSSVFAAWRRLKDRSSSTFKKNKMEDAVKRFLLGEVKGLAMSCFVSWKSWAAMSKKDREVSAVGTDIVQATHDKQLQVRIAGRLGAKTNKLALSEFFLTWKLQHELLRQEQAARSSHKETMKALANQVLMKKWKEDSIGLLALSFMQWRAEGKALRWDEVKMDLHRQLQEYAGLAEDLHFRCNNFEDQLRVAYNQVDSITDTLQKELQTKAELTEELREAYEKMRNTVLSPTTTGLISRPGSAHSRSLSTGRLEGLSGRRSLGAMPQATAGPADVVFDRLDRNHDGVITRAEWSRAMGGAAEETAAMSASPSTAATFARTGRSTASTGMSFGAAPPSRQTRAESPPRCQWDEVLKRVKEKRSSERSSAGSGVPQEPMTVL